MQSECRAKVCTKTRTAKRQPVSVEKRYKKDSVCHVTIGFGQKRHSRKTGQQPSGIQVGKTSETESPPSRVQLSSKLILIAWLCSSNIQYHSPDKCKLSTIHNASTIHLPPSTMRHPPSSPISIHHPAPSGHHPCTHDNFPGVTSLRNACSADICFLSYVRIYISLLLKYCMRIASLLCQKCF